MKKPPEKIYLQWRDDSIDPYDEVGITWCEEKINDNDIEYIKNVEMDSSLRPSSGMATTVGKEPTFAQNDKIGENASHLLTERQKEVIVAYSKYGLGKTAAKSLGITPRTFKNHCTLIYRKLEVHNMTQAIVMAFRAGILE
jgi:DNA-binding NarL/FixJ family response regulator